METDINVCRCCLSQSQGLLRNLDTTYVWLNTKEVYSDMLQECFNIVLSTMESENNMICETCITALRNSFNFKYQVLQAEQKLANKLKKILMEDNNNMMPVKLEPSEEKNIEQLDDDFVTDDRYADLTSTENFNFKLKEVKCLQKVKKEEVSSKRKVKECSVKYIGRWRGHPDKIRSLVTRLAHETSINLVEDNIDQETENTKITELVSEIDKKKKRTTKYADNIINGLEKDIFDMDHPEKPTREKELTAIIGLKGLKVKRSSIQNKDSRVIKPEQMSKNRQYIINTKDLISKKINLKWKRNDDKNKHKENLKNILRYSNVTPFKSKSLLGYICGYCSNTYPDPCDLRTHTSNNHKIDSLHLESCFDVLNNGVKLDITDLACTLCEKKVDNLSVLKDHLEKVHEILFFKDTKDLILQFKLKKGDVYDCVMCSSTYETFKMLLQHMNKHYSNYICSVCNASFTTKRSMAAHRRAHQEGSFKCDQCDKIFTSIGKKRYHENIQHAGKRTARNCPYCNDTFRSYYQRNMHLIKVHNNDAQYKCNVCSKTYVLKSLLMSHIKRSHLMERNHQCTHCGFKFFCKKALNAHMVKHTGERKYTCEECHKSYARKFTLREHMKIHTNDKRFKCDVCETAFLQKCSLRSHLLSHHGISMAACDIKKLEV